MYEVFHSLISARENKRPASALYLFPLKALGTDQDAKLKNLNAGLPEKDRLVINYLEGLDPHADEEKKAPDVAPKPGVSALESKTEFPFHVRFLLMESFSHLTPTECGYPRDQPR